MGLFYAFYNFIKLIEEKISVNQIKLEKTIHSFNKKNIDDNDDICIQKKGEYLKLEQFNVNRKNSLKYKFFFILFRFSKKITQTSPKQKNILLSSKNFPNKTLQMINFSANYSNCTTISPKKGDISRFYQTIFLKILFLISN